MLHTLAEGIIFQVDVIMSKTNQFLLILNELKDAKKNVQKMSF